MITQTFDRLKCVIGGKDFLISDRLFVRNPTLEEIIEFGEERFLCLISLLIARPYDFMVQLDDKGINYMEVDEFEFFLVNLHNMPQSETEILFGDIPFAEFQYGENEENGELIFYHDERNIVIDRLIAANITGFIRDINVISDEIEFKAGNERMRRSLIERARRKQKKNYNKPFESQLSNLISFVVNHEGFKYDYSTILKLHISQFYDAFYRLNKIEDYRQTMGGVYAGTINFEKLDKKNLNWTGNLITSQKDIDKSKQQLAPTTV